LSFTFCGLIALAFRSTKMVMTTTITTSAIREMIKVNAAKINY